MRKFAYVMSAVLILAGGGGYTYGTQGAGVEGLHETLREEPKNEVERISKDGKTSTESREGEGTGSHGKPTRNRTSGTIERSTAGEESDSALQASLGSGKDDLPDVTERARRASEDRKRAADRDNSSARMLSDNRAYGYLGNFTITAYTAGYESTQKKKGEKGYGVTATGTDVKEGRTIAADWAVLPPGTVVEIEGLEGTYVVEDRGGGVDGNHIDLYIESLLRAKDWGRQERSVWVVEWGV